MELYIRELNENDYDEILVGWWKQWGWLPPERDFLPDNGKGGIIVFDQDVPVCRFYVHNQFKSSLGRLDNIKQGIYKKTTKKGCH